MTILVGTRAYQRHTYIRLAYNKITFESILGIKCDNFGEIGKS